MRGALLLILALAGCSDRKKPDSSTAFTPRPPETRADFQAAIPRRFDALDHDKRGVLTAVDFPREPGRLARWDIDRDGRVQLTEFRAADIARFTAADSDNDGILTGAERVRADWGGQYGVAKK